MSPKQKYLQSLAQSARHAAKVARTEAECVVKWEAERAEAKAELDRVESAYFDLRESVPFSQRTEAQKATLRELWSRMEEIETQITVLGKSILCASAIAELHASDERSYRDRAVAVSREW